MKPAFVIASLAFGAGFLAISCASQDGQGSSSAPDASALVDSGASPDGVAPRDAGLAPLCVNGKSADGDYPARPTDISLLSTIPNLSFPGLDDHGAQTTIRLSDYFEPCAPTSRLLVLRVTTGWCGTCRYALQQTGALKANPSFGARLRFLDLEVRDEDGNPAAQDDLLRHRARIDAPECMGADPGYEISAVSATASILPLYVLVDTKSMQIRNYLANPSPAELEFRLGQELALLDGVPVPAYPDEPLTDSTFTRNEWALIQTMQMADSLSAPPPDPTNEKSDDPPAAALGKLFFSDQTLAPSGTLSCATCHDSQKSFADGLAQSEGAGHGVRNAPSLAVAAFSPWQFWDGRADSLWAQAAAPIENPVELGSSRLFVAHRIAVAYPAQYQAVWSNYPLPDMSDPARFPANGTPGDAAYDAMAAADKASVTRILVNVAKSVAAFERTIRVTPNRLDQYAGGDLTALADPEKKGLDAFMKVGCGQCHWGPRLTDDAFHNTRFPTGRLDGMGDPGRYAIVPTVLGGELISTSQWSDSNVVHPGISHLAAVPALLGSFKTPSLRGVPETAPYGHGGEIASLLDVASLYATAGLAAGNPRAVGVIEPWIPQFDQSSAPLLVPIMQVMTASPHAP